MVPRVEAVALAVVLAGIGLFLTVDPPLVGGVVVALGAELMAVGRLLASERPVPR